MFTPTRFATAEEKAKWFEKFQRFMKKGCLPKDFNGPLYRQLMNMFGHIAHYDKNGFAGEWFDDARRRVEFVKNMLLHPCYGSPEHTWSDVEVAIKEWIVNSVEGHLIYRALQDAAAAEAEQEARVALAVLIRRFPETAREVIAEEMPVAA